MAFRNHVIASVAIASPTIFDRTSKHHTDAREHLIENHGIRRNDSACIELRCCVETYPNRGEYAANSFSIDEVIAHVQADAGMNIHLLDYPDARPLLKWKDIRVVQIFVPHYRGDHRPRVTLSSQPTTTSPLFAQEFDSKLHQVKDDPLQTTELFLVYEQRKLAEAERKIKQLTASMIRDAIDNEQLDSHLVDDWCCEVKLIRIFSVADDGDDDAVQPQPSTPAAASAPTPSTSVPSSPSDQLVLWMPHIHWKIESMPGESPPVEITYLNQDVPPSLRQNIPPNLDDMSFVLGARAASATPLVDAAKITPRKFVELLNDCDRIKELLSYDPTFDDTMAPRYECLSLFKDKLDQLLEADPMMYDAARTFRVDCLRSWNQGYMAVDKYLWLPITPHDEMKHDEAMLAFVQICIDLGLIEKNDANEYSMCPDADLRTIFQYGDVLTIQKWYQLGDIILRKMTHIGKEEFVEMMTTVYNKFIKCHDYLHENIHRLQFIFTIYYGGFIQACQVLLGTKRIRQDPTKGKWRDSEVLTMKIYWSLRRIRLEEFLRKFMESEGAISRLNGDPHEVVWKLEKEYQTYCDSLEKCPCEKSRAAALFMKYTQEWILCRDGVSLGDWATLEVQGHDWLPRWFCVKKPQYREECQRRIEKMYALPFWLLEYLRMNRFIRMSTGAGFISLDDFCEKHNLAQKRSTKNPDFDIVCQRSRHLSVAQRCAKEIFGDDKNKKSRSTVRVIDDVKALYEFFRRVNIFTSPNVASKIDEMTFWRHVTPADFSETEGRKERREKQKVPLTSAQRNVINIFFDARGDAGHESDSGSESDDDNSDDSSVDSIGSHNSVGSTETTTSGMSILSDIASSGNRNEEPVIQSATLGTVAAQDAALKRLSNVSRCPMNMLLIKNLTDVGVKKMQKADIVVERRRELSDRNSMIQMIYDCVTAFKDRMLRTKRKMQIRRETLPERIARELEDWEQDYIYEMNVSD